MNDVNKDGLSAYNNLGRPASVDEIKSHTSASDVELVVRFVADTPLPHHETYINTQMPREIIQAARRLLEDEKSNNIRGEL